MGVWFRGIGKISSHHFLNCQPLLGHQVVQLVEFPKQVREGGSGEVVQNRTLKFELLSLVEYFLGGFVQKLMHGVDSLDNSVYCCRNTL